METEHLSALWVDHGFKTTFQTKPFVSLNAMERNVLTKSSLVVNVAQHTQHLCDCQFLVIQSGEIRCSWDSRVHAPISISALPVAMRTESTQTHPGQHRLGVRRAQPEEE